MAAFSRKIFLHFIGLTGKAAEFTKTLAALHKYFDGPTLYFVAILFAAKGHLNYKVFADNSKCMDLAVNGTATKIKPQFRAA